MNYGIDALALGKYPKIIESFLPKGWGVGVFSFVDGFGDSLGALSNLLARRTDIPFVRVHLMWKDKHDFTSRDNAFIQKEARRLLPIIRKYPNVKFYVSPICEHRLNAQGWNSFASIVSRELASVAFTLVNSPEKPMRVAGVVNEFHSKPNGDAFSFDGVSCFDADVESLKANYANAPYFMFWCSQCNGRLTVKDTTPRAKRQAYPVREQIEAMAALSGDKGATKLPAKWIFKSMSDQHTAKPAGKDCKPVWIIPNKTSEIVLKSASGRVIDRAKYYGTFEGGGHRYYHTNWGYKLAKVPVDVFIDNKKVGTINPAFRDGSFR